MLRIKITREGRELVAKQAAYVEPRIPMKRGVPVSVKRVSEILRIDPRIVRAFFVTTQDHKAYKSLEVGSIKELSALLRKGDHEIFFDEEYLMVWFDMHYLGMKELYYSRRQQWKAARVRIAQ